jgi:two-component system CheB/CheR fusion protein
MTENTQEHSVEMLLGYLKRTRGFDFGAYKRSSLERRITKRLQTIGLESYLDYVDYLEVHPEEFGQLFNTILINVTDFFRDEPAWELLARDILPRMLGAKEPHEPIRVWSAGCASGQEAYSIAMLLAEAMGEDQYRQRVKIYATDVDDEALGEARLAAYTEAQVSNVPLHLRQKYFEPANNRHVFRKDLRRAVIFGHHDLLQDAPISRVDLLICRNTLMYFNAEAQARILQRFDFALNGGGYLFLGKAEVLLVRSANFLPVDLKRRIFAKMATRRGRERAFAVPEPLPGLALALVTDDSRLRELALEVDPLAQILVDVNGALLLANTQARQLLGLSAENLGQRLQDVAAATYLVDLPRVLEQVMLERRTVAIKEVEWVVNGDKRYLDVLAIPLLTATAQLLGVKIVVTDVSRYHRLQDELQHSHQELETTNEELQSSNEELETTNEELQSTVEELETTNEELQSTNEELETMNEELQSTNEELETANEELRQRGDELNELNAFLEAIMASLTDGVVVLDRNMDVRAWNARAEDLWGLRADEVRGVHFMTLDIGLPVEKLMPLIRNTLSGAPVDGERSTVVDATNRRGKSIKVRVTAGRLAGLDSVSTGVILTMEDRPLEAEG